MSRLPHRRALVSAALVVATLAVVMAVTRLGGGEDAGEAAPPPTTQAAATPTTAAAPGGTAGSQVAQPDPRTAAAVDEPTTAAPPSGTDDGQLAQPEPDAADADDADVPGVRPDDGQLSIPGPESAAPAEGDAAPEPDDAPPADDDLAVEGGGGALPVDSPFDLPPMVQLQVGRSAPAAPALRRAVLRSGRLALSPAVREGVEAGRANAEALELLLRLGRVEQPLLVWRARGGAVRVQATSLAGTRQLVEHLHGATDIGLALRPVRGDFADEGRSLDDERMADIGAKAAQIALTQVGWPYSWGGGNAKGPSTGTCAGYRGSIRPCPAERTVGYDCSGLMLFAYAQVGIKLDHYAAFQWLEGRRIDSTQLVPGDMVFFHPKADGPGHVGMYVGDGKFVHAPHTGDVVKVSELADYASGYMGAVRPY